MRTLGVFLFLIGVASLAVAQDYKVVLKDSGRVASGRFVSEDDTSIVIEIGGMEARFRKSRLDLAKMKELNRSVPGKPSQASRTAAPDDAVKYPREPYDETPGYRAAAKDQQRSMQNEVARLKNVIKEWQAKPPSPQRDKDIQGLRETLRRKERELEDFNVEIGDSQDTEATRLRARMIQLERDVAREHREYFEALHRKAPQAELDSRLEKFLRLQKEAGEAREAFTRYMKARE